LRPTNADRDYSYPLEVSLGKIIVTANMTITVTCYFMRDNAGITGKLLCRAQQLSGITTDVYATTSLVGSWEQLQIQFVPTETGVVEIVGQAYGGAIYSVWVDDLFVTQSW